MNDSEEEDDFLSSTPPTSNRSSEPKCGAPPSFSSQAPYYCYSLPVESAESDLWSRLTILNLCGCLGLTNPKLPPMPSLVSLNVSKTSISDDTLAPLVYSQRLRTVNMSSCRNITSAALLYLEGIKTIRQLDLHGCRGVSDVEVRNWTQLEW